MARPKSMLTKITDAVGEATNKVKRTTHAFEVDATRALGKARRTVRQAASGVRKAAGTVERAMSPTKRGRKAKAGTARKVAGARTGSARSAIKKGAAKLKSFARKSGVAVAKAARSTARTSARKPARRTAGKTAKGSRARKT